MRAVLRHAKVKYPYRHSEIIFLASTGAVVFVMLVIAVVLVVVETRNSVPCGGGIQSVPNAPNPEPPQPPPPVAELHTEKKHRIPD